MARACKLSNASVETQEISILDVISIIDCISLGYNNDYDVCDIMEYVMKTGMEINNETEKERMRRASEYDMTEARKEQRHEEQIERNRISNSIKWKSMGAIIGKFSCRFPLHHSSHGGLDST